MSGNAFRPVRDERRADAAFVHPMLVLTKGSVGNRCPTSTVGDIRIRRTRHDVWSLANGITIASLCGHQCRRQLLGRQWSKRWRGQAWAILSLLRHSPPHLLGAAPVVLQ